MGINFFSCMLPFILQKGHVLRLLFTCQRFKLEKRTWSSSRVFGARYLLNQKSVLYIYSYMCIIYIHCWFVYSRLVHSFTCAGILPTQYLKFCKFAGMGHVGYRYMEKGKILC